jgi:hypothetical protein
MFTSKNKIEQVITVAAGAAGSSDINSSIVDTAGFDGVVFAIPFGPIVSLAATSVEVAGADLAGFSDAAVLEGTDITVADTGDNKTVFVEIKKPRNRYNRLTVKRATQNATIGGALAILYGAASEPVAHGSTVSGEAHLSPPQAS